MNDVTREEFDELKREVGELRALVSGKATMPEVEQAILAGERLEAFHQTFARRVYGEEHEA